MSPKRLLIIRAAIVLPLVTLVAAAALTMLTPRAEPTEPEVADITRPLSVVLRVPQNVHSAKDVNEMVRCLVANGVKCVWLQFKQDETDEFEGGTVFYPSHVAPVAEGYQVDLMGQLIDALAARGVEVYAWLPCLHDPAAAKRNPQWRAVAFDAEGDEETSDEWLCPRSDDVWEYQARIAAEIAARYPKIHGLYLDFIRYDSDYSCCCPRCLAELGQRVGWAASHQGEAIDAGDVLDAANRRTDVWGAWAKMRSQSICRGIATVRSAVERANPQCRLGACVLPFSAKDYAFNTQSGQDLHEMSRSGLDEMAIMGYWDDWEKSPQWVAEGLEAASESMDEHCQLKVLLDGDMSVRRTRATLEALNCWTGPIVFFQYGPWNDHEFGRVRRAVNANDRLGPMPRSPEVDVVVRIDTEPDDEFRYNTVTPKMIQQIMDLLEAEGTRGTFITCGRLAELQPDVIREAVKRGHDIGVHAYNHEQLDSLDDANQVAVIDQALRVYEKLKIPVYGFGAPRNSITEVVRNRLIEWNLEYDGSDAYDPTSSFMDAAYIYYTGNKEARIVTVPYISPNDYDARFEMHLSAPQMAEAWKTRLDKVLDSGEPCFVLDVHQWIVSRPDNLAALKDFLEYAKTQPRCRLTTLREAAKQTRVFLDQFDVPAATSGDHPGPFAYPPHPLEKESAEESQ